MNQTCRAADRSRRSRRRRRRLVLVTVLSALGVVGAQSAVLAQDEAPESPDRPDTTAVTDATAEQTTSDSLAVAEVPEPVDPLDEIRGYLATAGENGAKRHLPSAYRQLEDMIAQAETDGADDATLDELRVAGHRLVNQAEYLVEIRERQSPLEALLGRYDQSLREIAALMGTTLDPELSGAPSAADLYTKLRSERRQSQVLIDSLTVANRQLLGTVGVDAAGRDSTLEGMQAEISDLRHQLWETQLRVGIAEADRSAVASELASRKQFRATVGQLEADLGPNQGEVLITSGDVIVARIFGFEFPSGSAELQRSGQDLIDALARAVTGYGPAKITVDGHTDDTGTRDANLRLSRRRAEAVASALAGKLQIDAATIVAVGHGPDLPIATNSSDAGRVRNRRIEVTIAPAE